MHDQTKAEEETSSTKGDWMDGVLAGKVGCLD
jgi:hypothetical protein